MCNGCGPSREATSCVAVLYLIYLVPRCEFLYLLYFLNLYAKFIVVYLLFIIFYES